MRKFERVVVCSLPTVSPRCRRSKAVSVIFGAMQIEPLMPDRPKSEIPDQEGQGGMRRARVVEVHFRDASAHQT